MRRCPPRSVPAVVFPVDQPPIEDGVVTIEGDRIVSVGPHRAESNAIDLGDVALLPGLVNAHTHLEFSDLRQPLGHPGIGIVDWIRLIIAERARGDKWRAEPISLGQQESLAAGVTTLGDIVTNPAATCIAGIDATFFHEVIGFSRARAESSLNALIERLSIAAATQSAANVAPPIQGISPHAPYTVSPLLLRPLVTLAHRHNMPVAMHLAESREELQFLREGTGPFQELLEERSMWDPEAVPPRLNTPRLPAHARRRPAGPRHPRQLSGQRRARLLRHASRSNVARLLPAHPRLFPARLPIRSPPR